MTYRITTKINLPHAPEKVWRTLTDFSAYRTWNPFIVAIKGKAARGAKLNITLKSPKNKKYDFEATVLASDPGRMFCWRGTLMGMGLLFRGDHSFILRTTPGVEGTTLIHQEIFRGLLGGIIFSSIRADTERGFRAMNEALAQRLAVETDKIAGSV